MKQRIRRRSLIGALAALPLLGRRAGAQVAKSDMPLMPMIQGEQIAPGSIYGEMAAPGPNGPNAAPPLRITLPGQPGQNGQGILIWLPANALKARMLVFSHGELGSPELHDPLLRHWATHGFAVIAPVHQDSIIQNSVKDMAETRALGAKSVLTEVDAWKSRVESLRICLDARPWLESQIGVRLDDERPLIAGHSFGAFCASLLMGVSVALPSGSTLRINDPRFFAALMLSPQGKGVFGLGNDSWDAMRAPTMWLTGGGDIDVTGQLPDVKVEPYSLTPPGNRHLAWLNMVRSSWMSGAQVRPGDISDLVFADIKASTTAFIRAYGDYDDRILKAMSTAGMTIPSAGRLLMNYR